MPRIQPVMAEPVVVSFDGGAVQLTSVIDPETRIHYMTCDLCDQSVNIGKNGNAQPLIGHRASGRCKDRVNKAAKEAAKQRNLVSNSMCAIKICGLIIWL